MKNEDFKQLVEPLCMLTGYCRSAEDLTPQTNFKKWGERLMELAENLDNAWKKASLPRGE